MISVTVERDKRNHILAFTAHNHGTSDVCAAVSLMVLNTVNSIEALTSEAFTCDYKEDGGFLRFALNQPPKHGARLLLESMALGLRAVQAQYSDEIEIIDALGRE